MTSYASDGQEVALAPVASVVGACGPRCACCACLWLNSVVGRHAESLVDFAYRNVSILSPRRVSRHVNPEARRIHLDDVNEDEMISDNAQAYENFSTIIISSCIELAVLVAEENLVMEQNSAFHPQLSSRDFQR